MRYHTVFIDWDGTMSLSRFWEHWADSYPQQFARLQLALFVERPELVTPWMRGELSAEMVVAEVSNVITVDSAKLLEGLEQSCTRMQFITPTIVPTVQELRQRGIRVMIATDNMDTFHRWTVPALSLDKLFDGILSSAQIGALKNEATVDGASRFFDAYLAAHSILPDQVVLVDDSQGNASIRDFGIEVIKIDRGQDIVPILGDLMNA